MNLFRGMGKLDRSFKEIILIFLVIPGGSALAIVLLTIKLFRWALSFFSHF